LRDGALRRTLHELLGDVWAVRRKLCMQDGMLDEPKSMKPICALHHRLSEVAKLA
jgi:hypothetical protein